MDRRSHHKTTYYDHGHIAIWHYRLSGHQTRVVALGGIAKRKGVSSRVNLLISVKFLWITLSPLVTKPGQCPSTLPLKHKNKRSKEMKLRIKGNERDRKQWHLWQGATLPLQMHPHLRFTFPCCHCTPCPNTTPHHLIHSHNLNWFLPRKNPKLKGGLAQ